MLFALAGLENDLEDNEPAKRTPAHKTWAQLTEQTDVYAGIVEDYMAEVEMDAEEEAFENGDNEQE